MAVQLGTWHDFAVGVNNSLLLLSLTSVLGDLNGFYFYHQSCAMHNNSVQKTLQFSKSVTLYALIKIKEGSISKVKNLKNGSIPQLTLYPLLLPGAHSLHHRPLHIRENLCTVSKVLPLEVTFQHKRLSNR